MISASIILTADKSLMINPRMNLYQTYLTCFPEGFLLERLLKNMCVPIPRHKNGEVLLAPLPLRVVESILYRAGFEEKQIATIHPDDLNAFITSKTQIVGISTIDPLGMGPIPFTVNFFLGGRPYLKASFEELTYNLKFLKKKYSFKVVVGGPGAWQLADNELLDKYGIDYLIIGEAEDVLPNLFYELIMSHDLNKRIFFGKPADAEEIPPIRRPSICGLVEVMRGCGRGCSWCYSCFVSNRMRDVPIDTIKQSAEVAAKFNKGKVILQSDDLLLYGSKRFVPDVDAVLNLVRILYSIETIKNVSFLHFSYASIVALPEIVPRITDFLNTHHNNVNSKEIQIGLETGSVRLLERYMRGKALPFEPEDWHEVVVEGCKILRDNKWICYTTLILCLPDETAEDVKETIILIQKLRNFPIMFIPLLYTPLKLSRERSSYQARLLKEHIDLLHVIRGHNQKILQNKKLNPRIADFLVTLIRSYINLKGI